MSKHVDKFERICGQMAHNNPTKPPTEEEKIDWFLDSVTEKTYDSVHSTCTDKLLEGGLTFAKVLKLYTHRCFQRYPHFQVEDIDIDDKRLSPTTPPRSEDPATKAPRAASITRQSSQRQRQSRPPTQQRQRQGQLFLPQLWQSPTQTRPLLLLWWR